MLGFQVILKSLHLNRIHSENDLCITSIKEIVWTMKYVDEIVTELKKCACFDMLNHEVEKKHVHKLPFVIQTLILIQCKSQSNMHFECILSMNAVLCTT